jgi:hypothetical protein
MAAQAVEGIGGEPIPLRCRVEGIIAIPITSGDGRLAAQGVVGSADQPCAPFGARVNADLADHIDDTRAPAQNDRVIAIEPSRAVGLIGLSKDRRRRAAVGEDEHSAIGNRAD